MAALDEPVFALPGDVIHKQDESDGSDQEDQRAQVRLGRGAIQIGSEVVAIKAGDVRLRKRPRTVSVHSGQKRFIPHADDQVVGVVTGRHVEGYQVDFGAPQPGSLPALSFEGATKRNKPDLKVGSIVYCRVALAHKDMEPELTCMATAGGSRKDWTTGQTQFGELMAGYLFQCSTGLVDRLLHPESVVLQAIGKKMPFETAIGVNGKVWLKASTASLTILAVNAILNSEFLSSSKTEQMVEALWQLCLSQGSTEL